MGFFLRKNWIFLVIGLSVSFSLNLVYQINSDEGAVINGAWNLFNGKTMYKDFFETISPGSFYLISLAFKISPNYFSALIIAILFLFLSSVYLFLTANLIYGSRFWSSIVSILWIFIDSYSYPLINHNSFSSFLAIIFAYHFIIFLKKKNQFHLFVSGIFCAIIFYFLQTKGIALFFITCLFLVSLLIKKNIARKDLIIFLAGNFLILLIGYLWWGLNPLARVLEIHSGYLALVYQRLSWWPLLIFIILLLAVFPRSVKSDNTAVKFLFILQIGLLLSLYNFPESWHLLINSFPLLVILFIYIKNFLDQRRWAGAVYVISCFLAITFTLYVTENNQRQTFLNKKGINVIKKLAGDEKIFAFPFLPSLYFELGKENPYPYGMLFEGVTPIKYFDSNLEVLKKEKPKYIFTNYAIMKKFNHSFKNPIDLYIRKNYAIKQAFGDIEAWERL